MDYDRFYRRLFGPLEASLGPIDRDTIVAIVGFDGGGPLNFCTIGRSVNSPIVTYVSCEMAVRNQQQPSEFGRYELLTSCDDEQWVRSVVSDVGRMSFATVFGDGHTLDIGSWVKSSDSLQGIVFEKVYDCRISAKSYGILRVIGVTRRELQYARESGAPALLERLKAAKVYPNTCVGRASIV
jgi:hypothetical protein